MQFTTQTTNPEKQRSGCIVVGVFEKNKLTIPAKQLDTACKGYLQKLLKRGDMEGKLGHTLLLHDVPGVSAERILLVGCGEEKKLDEGQFKKIVSATIDAIKTLKINDAHLFLFEFPVDKRDSYWKIRLATETVGSALYQYSQASHKTKCMLKKIVFCANKASDLKDAGKAIKQGQAISEGMNLAKELGNLPGNICTPTYLAKEAQALSKKFKTLKTKVLNEAEMKKLGMGALLSVSQGSKQPAKLIITQYHGTNVKTPPIALVGKGITFDSGGISIKPSATMDEMKYDMCGAASVLGTLHAVAQLKLPINVVGIIAAAENLPSSTATKPGDVVKSMSKQTVEVLNTDAEGRLVLCDALTYCERFKPKTVIDIATLTGAMVVALGTDLGGLFSNDDRLAADLISAGKESNDPTWHMPLWEAYQDQLDSNFADMANIGSRWGGSITAACFLSRFTKKFKWAHLDIAGIAWNTGKNKGSTGRPVPLLTQYLLDQC